jgi:hypothetical protein
LAPSSCAPAGRAVTATATAAIATSNATNVLSLIRISS